MTILVRHAVGMLLGNTKTKKQCFRWSEAARLNEIAGHQTLTHQDISHNTATKLNLSGYERYSSQEDP
jgi:hypothetical protein